MRVWLGHKFLLGTMIFAYISLWIEFTSLRAVHVGDATLTWNIGGRNWNRGGWYVGKPSSYSAYPLHSGGGFLLQRQVTCGDGYELCLVLKALIPVIFLYNLRFMISQQPGQGFIWYVTVAEFAIMFFCSFYRVHTIRLLVSLSRFSCVME